MSSARKYNITVKYDSKCTACGNSIVGKPSPKDYPILQQQQQQKRKLTTTRGYGEYYYNNSSYLDSIDKNALINSSIDSTHRALLSISSAVLLVLSVPTIIVTWILLNPHRAPENLNPHTRVIPYCIISGYNTHL